MNTQFNSLVELRQFFNDIPEDQFTVGFLQFKDARCAQGHFNFATNGNAWKTIREDYDTLGITPLALSSANNNGSTPKAGTLDYLDSLISQTWHKADGNAYRTDKHRFLVSAPINQDGSIAVEDAAHVSSDAFATEEEFIAFLKDLKERFSWLYMKHYTLAS